MSTALVVGLLPAQARRIAAAFPQTGLKFLPRDRENELPAQMGRFDHVVVMTKFIPHQITDQVPKDKLIHCTGGPTALRRKLDQMNLTPTPAPSPTVDTTNMAATLDYSALKTAKPGEKFFFKRPHAISKETFAKQVMANRSYYKRQHGIETEQKEVPGGWNIVVNGPVLRATPPTLPAAAPVAKPLAAASSYWMEVYLRLIVSCPGLPDEHLAARADAAIAAYAARFPQGS